MYGTVALANIYFQTKQFDERSVWANATPDMKDVALYQASVRINALAFVSTKQAETQVDEFPRTDLGTPEAIEHAAYEIAFALLDGRDVDYEDENRGRTSTNRGRLAISRATHSFSVAKAHSIPSVKAWTLLHPFLRGANDLTIERVS